MCLWKKKREKEWIRLCSNSNDPDGSHPERAFLATEWCIGTYMGQYIKGHGPTKVCEIHHAPPPEPHIIDNPKPDWMPRMVAAVLRLPYDSVNLTDDQLKSFALKLSLAGVDYMRVMGDWESTFIPGPGVSAFKRFDNGRFDLSQENPAWDEALIRLKEILDKYLIKIYFDLIDRCDSDKGPWEYNINGFNSIYDVGLLTYYKRFFDRVYSILGPDAKYGLGNEFLNDHQDWILNCMLPLGEYMYPKIQKPLCFSGDDMTAHHLHGVLSPDRSAIFGIRDSCLVRHGSATPDQILSFLDQGSGDRCYAYSDDGVTMENYPEHGPCTPANVFCQGTIAQRISVVAAMVRRQFSEDHSRFDHIEFLPREISWDGDPNNITEESLRVYNDLSLALWGVDIRRRLE
jgi:hypothetical protein